MQVKKYILIISEQTYTELERLYFISFFDGSVYYPIYHSKTFDYIKYQNVKNDDKLLGFYAPIKVELQSPLCWSCKYYTHEPSYLGCAVNPNIKTNSCFECRDYVTTQDDDVKTFYNDPNDALREYDQESELYNSENRYI